MTARVQITGVDSTGCADVYLKRSASAGLAGYDLIIPALTFDERRQLAADLLGTLHADSALLDGT